MLVSFFHMVPSTQEMINIVLFLKTHINIIWFGLEYEINQVYSN